MKAPGDLARLRRRLALVLAFDALCLIVAAGGVYGYLSLHIGWMGALFAVAMLAGFAAQIWLVLAFARARKA